MSAADPTSTCVEHRNGVVCENERCDRDPRDAAVARSALGNAKDGVEDDTNDIRRVRPQKEHVKLNHQIPGHHVAANARCAQARSMAEAAENRHRGRRAAPRH